MVGTIIFIVRDPLPARLTATIVMLYSVLLLMIENLAINADDEDTLILFSGRSVVENVIV